MLQILQLALFSFPFSAIRLQAQESMLVQSQTCIQELTTELRNRCLELRETNQRVVEEEKFIQVKIMCKDCAMHSCLILHLEHWVQIYRDNIVFFKTNTVANRVVVVLFCFSNICYV